MKISDSKRIIKLNIKMRIYLRTKLGMLACVFVALMNSVSTHAMDGELDESFDPLSADVFAGEVTSIALQSNGQVIVGGEFTNIGGLARSNLARLNSDGSADPSFDPSPNFRVFKVAIGDDNKILVAGSFNQINGQAAYRLARLNEDGSTDPTFSPSIDNINGLEGVFTLLPLGASRVMIGGRFSSIGGNPYTNIAILNSDGSVSPSFDGTAGVALDIARQENGKYIVAGGLSSAYLRRFESDGEIDADFFPNPSGMSIDAVAIQSDGKILVAGDFSVISNMLASRFVRLNTDGSLDTSFPNLNPNGRVSSITVQEDDSIFIAGNFNMLGTQVANKIARLNADGSIDTNFQTPEIVGSISDIAIQNDNNILIGGVLVTIDDVIRRRIARLLNGSTPTEPPADDSNFIVIL